MCGITGYVGSGDKNILKKMTDTLSHRGPDAQGMYVDEYVGLGHARLSIIDLSSQGTQPMWNEDKTLAIVFNGEIYNFQALRAQLSHHTFTSQTDTEVIIHGYEEWGVEVFKKIDGMFAIALYDTRSHKIFLARDRVGEKPLYWTTQGNTLLFASEIKALVKHPLVKKDIDRDAIAYYLQFEYIPAPYTIYKGIHKLRPATILTWDGMIHAETYWTPFAPADIHSADPVSSLDTLINESVRDRLVSDVPLGVFLSGGLDSSTVAYYATRHSQKPVHTFSIGFEDSSFDESMYAQQVARALGTKHHHKIVTEHDLINAMRPIVTALDEPMADASIIPTYVLSKFAKQYVTVVLGGDGADELFAGYDTFLADRCARLVAWLPRSIFRGVHALSRVIPVSHRYMSFDFKIKKFLSGLIYPSYLRHHVWLSAFAPDEQEKLFSYVVDIDQFVKGKNVERQFFDLYLPDNILVKVDRASMMHGLEVRSPFLSTELIEFVQSLSFSWKLFGTTRKYILKKLMRSKLPKEITARRKKGFGIPIGQWFRGRLRPFVEETLSKKNTEQFGLFNHDYIDRMVREHMDKKADHRKKIWTLLVLYIWLQTHEH